MSKYLTDRACIVVVFIPLKLEGKAFTKIDDLTDDIADDHEPHEFEGLIEVDLGGGSYFYEIFFLVVFDGLVTVEHFVEFLDSVFFLNLIVSVGNEHKNTN